MKTIKRLVCTALVMALAVTGVFATPSTQIWIPSTDIQGFLKPHLGWDSYLTDHGTGSVTNGGITIGVLPFSKVGMEIGVDYRDISGDHRYPMYYNAKLGVPEDAFFKNMPAVAVGVYDMGVHYSTGVTGYATNYNVTYGLIAKTIGKAGRFSVGYYEGNDQLLLDLSSNGKKDASGILASWDRTMSEISDKLWLAVDYQGAKNSYGALSVGGSWAITPDASFIIGYDIFNDNDSYKPTATVQVDINLTPINEWFKKAAK